MEQDFVVDDGLVQRLHEMLAEALRRARPEPFGTPVTVAEIYQDLVPYRIVRSSLGFHMNADYEHTLLRLLAGEGGFAKLEPPEARDELRSELDTPNPNVGLFRKFAACDVWITATDLPEGVSKPTPVVASAAPPAAVHQQTPVRPAPVRAEPPAATPPVTGDWQTEGAAWAEPPADEAAEWDNLEAELLLEEEVETPDTSEQISPGSKKPVTDLREPTTMLESKAKPSAVADPAAGSCAFCHNGLPAGRAVRYCPFCGADQSLQPCGSCREPLEPGWKFCIACGARQS